jgi:hypothetical protein
MRRVLTIVLGISLLIPFGAAATAASQRYQNLNINAFWNSKQKIDADTYLRTTWYQGVWGSAEEGFGSDLYRDVERCIRQDGGGVRCRRISEWYGDLRNPDEGAFSVDKKLTSGSMEGTYRLRSRDSGGSVLVGVAHIETSLVGTGALAHGRSTYTDHEGCIVYKYGGKWRSRNAVATGTLSIGDTTIDLPATEEANLETADEIEVSHSC